MNTTSLGLYDAAYKISSLPISEVADVFGRVVFPVFSKISGDITRLKKAFVQTFLSVLVLTIPFGLVFYFFPREIIVIVLGSNWLEAAPVLRVLSVLGIIRGLMGPVSALFLSLKKQEYVTYVTLAGVIGLMVTIIPLVKMYGIYGAGIAAMIGAFASWPFAAYYLMKIFKSSK